MNERLDYTVELPKFNTTTIKVVASSIVKSYIYYGYCFWKNLRVF